MSHKNAPSKVLLLAWKLDLQATLILKTAIPESIGVMEQMVDTLGIVNPLEMKVSRQ